MRHINMLWRIFVCFYLLNYKNKLHIIAYRIKIIIEI